MSLSHFDEQGRANMVDVGHKNDTLRIAVAKGIVEMLPATLSLIHAQKVGKGDVLGVAQIAGIMAAKKTSDLIPMCHPLMLTKVALEFTMHPATTPNGSATIEITATVRTTGKTGVEMEALTAVTIAGLTIYDMCKSVDKAMRLEAVRLIQKTGGKSGSIILE